MEFDVVGVVAKNGDTAVVVGVVATSAATDGVNCASFNKKFRFSDDSDETVNEIKYKHVYKKKRNRMLEKKISCNYKRKANRLRLPTK